MNPETIPDVGTTYYCPVCGARVTVLQPGAGSLLPRCCGVAMLPVAGEPLPVYFCPICGAEVAVLRDDRENLRLVCCGASMIRQRK